VPPGIRFWIANRRGQHTRVDGDSYLSTSDAGSLLWCDERVSDEIISLAHDDSRAAGAASAGIKRNTQRRRPRVIHLFIAAWWVALTIAAPAGAADLARRADWQVHIRSPNGHPWAEVLSVDAGSGAARAGLRVGDHITFVNDTELQLAHHFDDARQASRAGVPVRLRVTRDEHAMQITFTPRALAFESDPALEITYSVVTSAVGIRQRTILTKPPGNSGKLPSLILVPWLSCSSVEVLNRKARGMDALLAGILQRSGYLTLRVERPGVGDSEGPACSQTDFTTEWAGLRAGLAQLKTQPSFDPKRLFLLGMSLGGGLAPLLAEGDEVRGIVSVCGVVKTWFEHMLEIERRRMTLSGNTPGEVNERMRGFEEFYTEYLIRGKTPAQVIREHPQWQSLWYDEPAHQYGRPAAYYQEVQELNLEAAWAKVRAPTLVISGEYDWIMSQDDYERMAALVNNNSPGAATLVQWPRASHELERFASRKAAFEEEGGTFDDAIIDLVVAWLRKEGALSSS
jgi:pimeloyl-ACP methyl ester carboxylesterase